MVRLTGIDISVADKLSCCISCYTLGIIQLVQRVYLQARLCIRLTCSSMMRCDAAIIRLAARDYSLVHEAAVDDVCKVPLRFEALHAAQLIGATN